MAEIEPEKYYTPRKLVSMHILPWSSARTFTKKLHEPMWQEVFKPIIEEANNKLMIYVKGENIIKFKELAANGKLNITNDKINSNRESL